MSSFKEMANRKCSGSGPRKRGEVQPELKMNIWKEQVNRKCKHFLLGSGSKKVGGTAAGAQNEQFCKGRCFGYVSISGSGPAPGKERGAQPDLK